MNPLPRSLSLASIMVVVGLSWGGLSRAADPFTIVVLPDTQHYTDNGQNYAHFVAQSRWLGSNIATENIVFTTHVGDIVESNGADPLQWLRADRVLSRFDVYPSFPYGVALGNHDYDNVSSNPSDSADAYISRFGAERYLGKPWYGGSSPDQRSHWQRFYAGGRVFHHITLEWQGASAANNNSPEVTSWVQSVLDAHPNTPTILTTHEYLGGPLGAGRSAAGEDIFNALIRENSQVFLVIGGHALGENHRVVRNAAGEPVYEILANFQNLAEGGTGYLLLLKFDEDHGRIIASTYSPSLRMLKQGEASQYSLALSFEDRLGPGERALPIWWGQPHALAVDSEEAELRAAINRNSADLKIVWDTVDRGTRKVVDWANVASLPAWTGGDGMVAANLQALSEGTEYCCRFVARDPELSTDSWSKPGTFMTGEIRETAYQHYVESFGLELDSNHPGADPDHDLLTNLEEFAYGLDPARSDHRTLQVDDLAGSFLKGLPLTIGSDESSRFSLRYVRRIDHLAAGLSYNLQFSADLLAWEDSGTLPAVLLQDLVTGCELVQVDYPLTDGGNAQFYRMLITLEAE